MFDTAPTSDVVCVDVVLVSVDFIEQHEPLFLALDMEQLCAFSVEDSLVDLASMLHLSFDAFLAFDDFIEQHEDFSDLAEAFVSPEPAPDNAIADAVKRATIGITHMRIFMADPIDGTLVLVFALRTVK